MQYRASLSVRVAVSLSLSSILAAGCGGGGGGGTGDGALSLGLRSAAEGFWAGTPPGSTQRSDVVILEDGSTWGVQTDGTGITSALRGNSSIDGSSFTSTVTAYSYQGGTSATVAYAGTGTPRSRIDASATGAPPLALRWDARYTQAPNVAALAGRYALDASTVLAISANGAFSWIENADCVLNGQVTPRPNGRNVYTLFATYHGQGCVHGDGTNVSGVAYLDGASSPPRFVSLALRPDNWLGFASRAARYEEAPAPEPAPSPSPSPAPAPSPLQISAGHYPPPGMCRIWIPGVPPGQQSPPGDCTLLEQQVPATGVLIRG